MMSERHNSPELTASRLLTCIIQILFLISLNQPVYANDTVFIHAVKNSDTELIGFLAKSQTNIDLPDDSGKTALMVAAKAGDSTLVRQLLDKGAQADKINNNGGNALMFASISGDITTVELLLSQQVDVNARGSNGWGALMIASAKGHVEVARLLLDSGADANTVDVYDWTPLHRASYENHVAIVSLLLTATDIRRDARDDHGATALHHASIQGNYEISRLLIEHGASVRMPDHEGYTAMDYALKNGFEELAQLLNYSTGQRNGYQADDVHAQ